MYFPSVCTLIIHAFQRNVFLFISKLMQILFKCSIDSNRGVKLLLSHICHLSNKLVRIVIYSSFVTGKQTCYSVINLNRFVEWSNYIIYVFSEKYKN